MPRNEMCEAEDQAGGNQAHSCLQCSAEENFFRKAAQDAYGGNFPQFHRNKKLCELLLQLLRPHKISTAVKRQRHDERRGAEGLKNHAWNHLGSSVEEQFPRELALEENPDEGNQKKN